MGNEIGLTSLEVKTRLQSRKLQIQGVHILRGEAYLHCAAMIYPVKSASPSRLREFNRAGDEAQRRSRTFYETILKWERTLK